MTGTIEELTFNARIERLKAFAAEFVEVLRAAGSAMNLGAALNEVAARLRVAIEQVKYGLTYARSKGLVVIDERNALVFLPSAA